MNMNVEWDVALAFGLGLLTTCAISMVRSRAGKKTGKSRYPPAVPIEEEEWEDEESEDEENTTLPVPIRNDFGIMNVPYKMVLVIDQELGMSKGKIAAQCGHATLVQTEFLIVFVTYSSHILQLSDLLRLSLLFSPLVSLPRSFHLGTTTTSAASRLGTAGRIQACAGECYELCAVVGAQWSSQSCGEELRATRNARNSRACASQRPGDLHRHGRRSHANSRRQPHSTGHRAGTRC